MSNSTKLILKRDADTSDGGERFFQVLCDGNHVGRIYRCTPDWRPETNTSWFWGLAHPHDQGRIKPHYGHARTRTLAMEAFRRVWDSKA